MYGCHGCPRNSTSHTWAVLRNQAARAVAPSQQFRASIGAEAPVQLTPLPKIPHALTACRTRPDPPMNISEIIDLELLQTGDVISSSASTPAAGVFAGIFCAVTLVMFLMTFGRVYLHRRRQAAHPDSISKRQSSTASIAIDTAGHKPHDAADKDSEAQSKVAAYVAAAEGTRTDAPSSPGAGISASLSDVAVPLGLSPEQRAAVKAMSQQAAMQDAKTSPGVKRFTPSRVLQSTFSPGQAKYSPLSKRVDESDEERLAKMFITLSKPSQESTCGVSLGDAHGGIVAIKLALDGLAANAGMQVGDVVRSINHEPVSSKETAQELMLAAEGEVVVAVERVLPKEDQENMQPKDAAVCI